MYTNFPARFWQDLMIMVSPQELHQARYLLQQGQTNKWGVEFA